MVYSFDLDMTPGGVPQIVRLSRYDKKIPELEFTLWNGASGYTIPTGATVFITGSKPDKTGFEYECTYTGSVVSVEVTEQMTAVAGRVVCELTVATSNGKKGSANFFLDVEPSALSDDTVISETDIPIIQHIPEIVAECEDYAETAHKWATFGNDSETPSSTNNALYWAQKAQEYAVGALHWKASVAFANIPTTGMEVGYMYNITDAFTTDARFDEGAGVKCSAGTNIVWDANGKWDILISSTNAADINFDNTGTGMTATNVQNAITELNTGKNELNSNLSDLAITRSKLGAKNLFERFSYEEFKANAVSGYSFNDETKTASSRGLSFTFNDDGTVTINGSLNDKAGLFPLLRSALKLPAGNYIVSGVSSSDVPSSTSWGISIRGKNNSIVCNNLNGGDKSFTVDDTELDGTQNYQRLELVFNTAVIGHTFNNVVVKPMIRLATDHDSTYQPYAMTNKELTGAVAQLNSNLTELDAEVDGKLDNYKVVFTGATQINVGGASGDIYFNVRISENYIMQVEFNYQYGITLSVSTDNGGSWTPYWTK